MHASGQDDDRRTPRWPPPATPPGARQRGGNVFVDAGLGLGLLATLALIYLLAPRPSDVPPKTATSAAVPVEVDVDDDPEPRAAHSLRLAVTPPDFDDMGRLLNTLGAGYQYQQISLDDLLDAEKLQDFDVVFLTCAGAPWHWLSKRVGSGDRGSPGVFEVRDGLDVQLHTSLRQFVREGGTLYASDWQFRLVAIAFPEFVDQQHIARGLAQTVFAEVVDAGLRKQLGQGLIQLRFDQQGWYSAAFSGPQVTTLLRGKYRAETAKHVYGPLLVTFPFHKGNVIFTSFHNEAQNSAIEQKLLRHLVFTTVTAATAAQIHRKLLRGGFSAAERDLLSVSAPDQPISQVHECTAACDLQFVLGFENRGAELRLTVIAPDGLSYVQTGQSTFTINIPHAAAGHWQYTITPLHLPHANFPFTLTVGEKR